MPGKARIGEPYSRTQVLEEWLQIFGRLDLRCSCQLSLSRSLDVFRPFVHSFFPFLKHSLECIIDEGIEPIRVSLNEGEIQGTDIDDLAFLFLPLSVSTLKLLLDALDALKSFSEIIVAVLTFVISFFDEFKCTQSKTAVFVGLAKETNWLAFSSQTADSLFIRNVEG